MDSEIELGLLGSNKNPLYPSFTKTRLSETFEAKIGLPHAKASQTTFGRPSYFEESINKSADFKRGNGFFLKLIILIFSLLKSILISKEMFV